MAKLFQTRDVKMAMNLSCVQGARALGSMRLGIGRCSIADVLFEREWLRIGTIDHHQPLTTVQTLLPAGGTDLATALLDLYTQMEGWKRSIVSVRS
jgi:hypothetical protein